MKKLLKKPLFWFVSVEIIIVIILVFLGFKITYNPDLDNNWDAVSACAAWAGVVVSGIAIYFAKEVSIRIAESENNIATFEKRYQLYKSLLPLVEFGNKLSEISEKELKNMDAKTRARLYLLKYLEAISFNSDEIIDIALNFKCKDRDEYKSLECEAHPRKSMNVYKLKLRQLINSDKSTIELTSFLFEKETEKILQNLAFAYSNYMNLVCSSSGLEDINISNTSKSKDEIILEENILANEARIALDKAKNEFLNIIKELSNNNILEEIKGYLRIRSEW